MVLGMQRGGMRGRGVGRGSRGGFKYCYPGIMPQEEAAEGVKRQSFNFHAFHRALLSSYIITFFLEQMHQGRLKLNASNRYHIFQVGLG